MESGLGLLAKLIFSCITFSNFFNLVQFWCGNEGSAFWPLPGSFCTLFGHSMAIFFLKTAEYKASIFAAVFFFIFPPMMTWAWAKLRKSKFYRLLLISSSSPCRGAKKRMKIEKIDGCRMNFTCCSSSYPAHQGRRNENEKGLENHHLCFRILGERERKIWNKKCRVEVKGHWVSPLFQRKIIFKADFSPQKRPGPTVMRSM